MASASAAKKRAPSPLQGEVEQACRDIAASSTSKEVRGALGAIKIVKVAEVDVEATGRKALIVTVPFVQYKTLIKPNQGRCVAELEKKTKRHVCVVAQRTMLAPNTKQLGHRYRPYSRTLTSIQRCLIEDVTSPAEVCGKRTRIGTDGKQTIRVLLDPKDRAKDNIEEKLATYGAVYRALTEKEAIFEFAEYVL